MDKLITFHMNQLGDLLFSLPVLEAVKKQYPDAAVYCVVKPNLAGFLGALELSGKIFIKEKNLFKKLRLIQAIRKEKIENALLFSESPETLITAFCCGIKKRTGFKTAGLSFLLNGKAEKKGVPSLANNINLAKKAGIGNVRADYTGIINTDSFDNAGVLKWMKENGIKEKEFIAVAAGASARRREKCLKKNVWAETVNALHARGKQVVLAGAEWEREDIETIAGMCEKKPAAYFPGNGLEDMAVFLAKSEFFIGIDSGLMHLAASLGVKCVALYGGTDPSQIGPQPVGRHMIIKKESAKDITANDIIEKAVNINTAE